MNILHLSDIHFGRNYLQYGLKDHFEKHDQILNELIEKIADMDQELKPEHIVVTGDIVWNGKENEYKEALLWFKRLLVACGLKGSDLSFCVGNHDIDLADPNGASGIEAESADELDDAYRYENIHKMEPWLYEYNNFCAELGVEPYVYPRAGKRCYSYSVGFKDVSFSDGKTIRILAMNTSLRMTKKQVLADRMWLGREQILSLMTYGILPADEKIWYTIGLLHHSDRFLDPRETSTYDGRSASLPLLMDLTDLLLCGHAESCGRPRILRQAGGGKLLLGGAAYYSDNHINAFSMLYISEKKRAMAYIPYVYQDGWIDCELETFTRQKPQKKMEEEGIRYFDLYLLLEKENLEENASVTNDKVKKEKNFVAEKEVSSFEIPCKSVSVYEYEKNHILYRRFSNAREVTRNLCIEADGPRDQLVLSISPNEDRMGSGQTDKIYQKLIEFVTEAEGKCRCSLVTKNRNKLFDFSAFNLEQKKVREEEK